MTWRRVSSGSYFQVLLCSRQLRDENLVKKMMLYSETSLTVYLVLTVFGDEILLRYRGRASTEFYLLTTSKNSC
jgi:hypothetical protein